MPGRVHPDDLPRPRWLVLRRGRRGMTLYERIHGPQPRPCRTPGCQRSPYWPRDPEVRAAFCRECTDAILIGPHVSTWVRLAREHELPARIDGGVPVR